MGKEPIAYNDGRPVFEGQIEPGYTKFTWQHSLWDSTDDRIRASTIAVAAVLTDHADMATCVAWPSLETIAKCSHLSVRTVQRILGDLEELGWINYLRRGGGMRSRRSIHDQPRGFPNTYQLVLPDRVDIENRGPDIEGPNMDIDDKKVANRDQRVDVSDSNVDTHVQQTIKEERGVSTLSILFASSNISSIHLIPALIVAVVPPFSCITNDLNLLFSNIPWLSNNPPT